LISWGANFFCVLVSIFISRNTGRRSCHLDRSHPSGGDDGISRPRGFGTPGDTRIASGRRRAVRVRIWGGPAAFLPNDHSQTTTVGAVCVSLVPLVQPLGGGGCGRTTAAVVVRRMEGRVAVLVQPSVDFKESWSILFEKLGVATSCLGVPLINIGGGGSYTFLGSGLSFAK
jgi:hypothetical protein